MAPRSATLSEAQPLDSSFRSLITSALLLVLESLWALASLLVSVTVSGSGWRPPTRVLLSALCRCRCAHQSRHQCDPQSSRCGPQSSYCGVSDNARVSTQPRPQRAAPPSKSHSKLRTARPEPCL